MAYISQEELLEATNGGLEIIFMVYPQAHGCESDKRKKFKCRGTEKTASAAIKKLEDGNWVVTDFGGDQKPRNGVQCYMLEEGMEYKEALQFLAAHFNVKGADEKPLIKADFEIKPATADQNEGDYFYEDKDWTPQELELVGGKMFTAEMAAKQFLYSLKSYTYVRKSKSTGELMQYINKSTAQYPIFQFVFDDKVKGRWGKRLEPKAHNKADRFRYFGTRPKDFIMGLHLVRKAYDKLNEAEDDDYQSDDPDKQKEERKTKKIPEIVWCSGDRDALSVMALGFPVIWLNSESAILKESQFAQLEKWGWKICRIGDIDAPGIRQSHRLCMQFLDLHNVKLPEELTQKRDHRGNPCKDVRDFLQHYRSYELRELIKLAIPYRMWDVKWKYDTAKKLRYKTYAINPLQLYTFLEANGYYRFRLPNTKTGYIYIHIEGNQVQEIDPVEIKNFVNKFLEERKVDPDIRNTFYNSPNKLGEQSLSNLSLIEIDFTDYTSKSQYFFFEQSTWEVDQNGIKEYKPGEVKKFVWADEVMKHKVKVLDTPPYEVYFDDAKGRLDIKIHKTDCLFLKYLINTSRIYWKEQEKLHADGLKLSDDMLYEQRLHLINKLYSLGYLLHRYKDSNRPWAVYAMDNKISDDGESSGGSGKSIAYKAIRYFMKYVTLEGRNPRLTENPHIWENVTSHTDYVLVDDANQYLKFDFFYSALTGEMNVNPKHGKQYELPFEEVPKIAITSNFGLRNTDSSTVRRILYTVFSDYYHFNKDGEYERDWSPALEFGKNLFQDFDKNEWDLFFNTMAHALVCYLNNDKIDPPMENVHKRNLVVAMTDPFKEWAEVYFSESSVNCDTLIPKSVAMDNYFNHNPRDRHKWSTNKFTIALKAFCRYHEYELNPPSLKNSGGRIIRKHEGKAEEHIYIKAFDTTINDEKGEGTAFTPSKQTQAKLGQALTDQDDDDDLPF
ncbi:hypothetical protein Oweho_3227 [Owenweeksia hongkongensis DSM 17368]|uniref:Uncharacterized protein n=1 Tax=Owenweeksia hongkongensis (strain DSM 17368 / CIP 108786 / JCM 12287 / NRRL B-23963 / UST20020801) TaxID=926562 RepID=G8R3U1_OWEHD|nr:hypothetical protein [Owenweeksia hongkongensis]AEV34178.1 hypothetical protein Oweho_3227 [Owenweeksia hongkongensis DSM 17368]